MPTPSKFTADRRKIILDALRIGSAKATAAQLARIDITTLDRWLEQGKNAEEGSRFREFYLDVKEAEASPRQRALGIITREMGDNPTYAWKFLERKEPGYAPPMPSMPAPQGPVVIELSLSGGQPLALPGAGEIIEGEVVGEQDEESDTAPASTT